MSVRVKDISGLFEKTMMVNASKNASSKDEVFWVGTGWHFYTHLRLTQDIERSDAFSDAKKQMNILQSYIAVATQLTRDFEFAKLLEVQGSTNHFFLELGKNQVCEVIEFAKKATLYVENEVLKKAGKDFRQFHQAADYGQSIILKLTSVEEASESFLSLGKCANVPAKKMVESKEGVTCPLWLSRRENDKTQEWDCIETKSDSGIKLAESIEGNYAKLRQIAESVSFSRVQRRGVIKEAVAKFASKPLGNQATPETPEIIEAFLCRADMDGFTRKVEEAFTNGGNEVVELVEQFLKTAKVVMSYKDNKDGKGLDVDVIDLPWAGDCVNFVALCPKGETYQDVAKYLPLRVAKRWHELVGDSQEKKEYAEYFEWVFCFAGGRVFLADVTSDDRKFRVVCGWPSGTSHDGVNCDGTRPKWTIAHKDNVMELSERKRKIFHGMSSDFRYATLQEITAAQNEDSRVSINQATSSSIVVGGQQKKVHLSQPYYSMPHQ